MTFAPGAPTPSTENDLVQTASVVAEPETAFQEILVIAKSENGADEFLTAEKLSLAVAEDPSDAVAVQTQLVVQTIESSYFPVTVPLVPSHAAEMSSCAPFHAHEQR